MSQYLTVAGFKDLTVMPAAYVDQLEAQQAGWLTGQLGYWSDWIDSRLRKRYAAPFATPYPNAVLGWLARLVTLRAWLRRGVNAQDEQFEEIKADADAAKDEIREAAEAVEGLFDLPLRQDTTATGITHGGPRSYTEQSPYVGLDEQRRIGRDEDLGRGGSFG